MLGAEGRVDEAGAIVYGWVRSGGDGAAAVAALGHALVSEDAEFHWFQTVEAAVRQAAAWPDGSDPQALLLAAAARFLAAHTPTRRELPQVVRIASRLRRGENLFEEALDPGRAPPVQHRRQPLQGPGGPDAPPEQVVAVDQDHRGDLLQLGSLPLAEGVRLRRRQHHIRASGADLLEVDRRVGRRVVGEHVGDAGGLEQRSTRRCGR